MSTRKSMKLPVVFTLIIIVIIIYLFVTIKQSEVVCEKTMVYDADFRLEERIVSTLDGKNIRKMDVTKKVILPSKYSNSENIDNIKSSLDKTLNYLGDKVDYVADDNTLTVRINVEKNEIILLDNISFSDNGSLETKINSNTKSGEVVALSIGDSYTDGELMKYMKSKGYRCK